MSWLVSERAVWPKVEQLVDGVAVGIAVWLGLRISDPEPNGASPHVLEGTAVAERAIDAHLRGSYGRWGPLPSGLRPFLGLGLLRGGSRGALP